MSKSDDALILIVDDDEGIRFVLRRLLEKDGYRVEEAVNGVTALEAVARLSPDIVLMDIRMPIMDGAAACAKIQTLPGGDRLPVLMITALNDRESIDKCFEAGATDYLTKPINNAVLRQRVRRLLRTRRAEEALRASEARLSSIIEISADAILLVDAELRIQLFNPSAEHIFGYHPDEMIGRSVEVLMPEWFAATHAEFLRAYDASPLAGWPLGTYREGVGRRKDDTEFPIEISIGRIDQDHYTVFTVTLRDITRRKQAEAEIKKRVEQLDALSQMGQAVTTRLDLDGVLKTVIDEVMPRLQAEGVSVLLLENQTELVFAAVNGASADRLRGQRIPASIGIAGEVMRTKRPMRTETEHDLAHIYRDIELITRYHALDLVAVPLILGSEAIGVMEAVHQRIHIFTSDDLRLLEAAANWASIAIGNARQHQSLQRRLRESEVMAAIGRALNETLDLDHILQLIVVSARQIIPTADRSVILMFDEEQNTVRVVTEQGRVDRQLQEPPHRLADEAIRELIAQDHVVNIGDLSVSGMTQPIGVAPDVHSLLAAPVHGGSQHFGVISVQSAAPYAFVADDERLLAALGDEAAIAIQNARLYTSEHTQRELAEALRDTAATLTSTLDLEEVLDRILNSVGRVVPHASANIMLVEAGVARVARVRGPSQRDVTDQLMARRWSVPDTPHLREMAETQQPLLIADTRQFAGWEMPTVRSFIGASIRFKRKLSGFLNLESETPNFFLPAYADRLQIFANQAAVAIENARLYQLEQEQFQQWQQSQAALAQAEKMSALDRLAATVAQDIDRPLQAIQHHLRQIADMPEYTPNQLQVFDAVRQEVDSLRQMTRNMSTFAQPAPELRRLMMIDEVIHNALAEVATPIEHYDIRVTTDLQLTPPVSVAPRQMTQVFVNLLLNAIEAVQHRGQIHIATQAETAHVVVTIINDGPPIRPENLPHIFEPFFTTKKGSTGLGLTISHSLVQQHGGTITATNLTTQRGAVMTLKLPVVGTG